MMSTFDVVLIDLQDLGCRIYTFITTLLYMLEAAAEHGKAVWVLDRPNPAGRPVEGTTLLPGWESFVGAGPMPMRHGLTLGEMGHWFIDHFKLDVDYRVIEMEGWQPDAAPGFGWPADRVWINPSPNAANLNMARAYAGTVMLEGATLERGQGHHPPARTVRRARHRRARGAGRDASASRRTGSPAARSARSASSRPSTSTSAHSVQRPAYSTPKGAFYDHDAFQPVAAPGAGVQGDPHALPRLRSVARFPLRICLRQARHRRHQRRPGACANGSTMRARKRATSTRSRVRTKQRGSTRRGHCGSTDRADSTKRIYRL